MNSVRYFITIILGSIFLAGQALCQCENWNDSPKREEAEDAHSSYRSALKMKDFTLAYDEWRKAFSIAPAADGQRDFHYQDGIALYKQQLQETSDEDRRKELIGEILKLYDQVASCYESGGLMIRDCDEHCRRFRAAQYIGRKGYDMFYEFNMPYETNLKVFEEALDKSGGNVEYIVFEPVANIVVYQFQQGRMTADEVRALHEKLVEAADFGIENSPDYKAYYESAKARMLSKFAEIESQVFDCDYFKGKLVPMYNENPSDVDIVKYVYNKLVLEGCSKEDPFLVKLQKEYEAYANEENARLQAEFEASNPGVVANRLYREGDFENAVVKYQEALTSEKDPDKRAQYYFNIASIEFRRLGKLQESRANALKAAELRPRWGQPYLLIGDIYARAAKACGGDAWGQRIVVLAALDKYLHAKAIDASTAEEANRKISIYNANKPSKDDAFMRGLSEGDTLSTGCWIGEQTKLRVQ